MDKQNPGLTGTFNDGQKRIDLVLVMKDKGDNNSEEIQINVLMNAIKFGLELELEAGMMPEHRDLMFIKVHAPEYIIEEYGLYYDERRFFKNIHVEFINPFISLLGMKHERELIKIVRKQFSGTVNYSTLERSMIVYKIFLQLPFGQQVNRFGLKILLENNIIHDAYALHDGPYFIPSGQDRSTVNARQALFYNWVGIINIWKIQPIHMIQEYLGIRVALYFAYFDYINWMFLVLAIVGFWVCLLNLQKNYWEKHLTCYSWHYQIRKYFFTCPACRNFTLCPFKYMWEYCPELYFISTIDTSETFKFSVFNCFWGIILAILWKRKHQYLTWIWEFNERSNKNIGKTEYYARQNVYRSHLTGITLYRSKVFQVFKRVVIVFVSLLLLSVWTFSLFVISIYIWYIKFWMYTIDPVAKLVYREHLYIAVGAGVYSILVTVMKMFTTILSYILTDVENHKTFASYDYSLALRLYAFNFTGTFALLTFYAFIGEGYFTDLLDMNRWYTFGGYGVMNNVYGTSLDDICIILATAIIIEQIIIKIPTYFNNGWTDYDSVSNHNNSPCWEREYRLPTLKENFFHNGYCNLLIQFAMATQFSLTFPIAALLIVLINMWDIKYRARNILLACRRPLLLNATGPGIWHKLLHATAFAIPIFNAIVLGFHAFSHLLHEYDFFKIGPIPIKMFNSFKGVGSPAEEMKKLTISHEHCHVWRHRQWALFDNKFCRTNKNISYELFKYYYIALYVAVVTLVNCFLHYLISTRSDVIEDAVTEERKIRKKYLIEKGCLPNS